MTSDELISQIKGSNEKVRGEAWQNAGPIGAPAVKPLAGIAAEAQQEVARAATRALWVIVRHAGRPGAAQERRDVVTELLAVLSEHESPRLRSDVIWMLSEIAGRRAIAPLAALLTDETLREDARMALERIEGDASLAALRAAFKTAPEDFRPNLAYSLQQRGEKVEGVPDLRLKPVKPTSVTQSADKPT
jgi:HEAT repeat protein